MSNLLDIHTAVLFSKILNMRAVLGIAGVCSLRTTSMSCGMRTWYEGFHAMKVSTTKVRELRIVIIYGAASRVRRSFRLRASTELLSTAALSRRVLVCCSRPRDVLRQV